MSLPADFLEDMRHRLGETEFTAFLAAFDEPPPVSIHLNPLKLPTWPENVDKVKWCDTGVYLPQRPVFTLDPLFHAGAYYVQEASSMFVAEVVRQLAGLEGALRVLDLCAAPGGKSTLLASVLPVGSLLVANEVIRARYQVLRYNLYKWGHAHTFSTNLDSRQYADLADFFDVVLVDAPCSGEGLFRRDPGAAEEWSHANVQHCAARQQRILADAADLVRPGGVLLYSTCTYNEHENLRNAHWLEENFALKEERLEIPPDWNIVESDKGYQFYPHRVRGEGLYVAAFRKSGSGLGQSERLPDPPFRHWTPLTRQHREQAGRWTHSDSELLYFADNRQQWWGLPAHLAADARRLAAALGRIDMGFPIGQPKGRDLIPAPELALHTLADPEIPILEVDTDTALRLLRKDTPDIPRLPTGWTLIRCQGQGLLWLKGLGNRYNNYYPSAWRIRMEV